MLRAQVRCHDHPLVINLNFRHRVEVIFLILGMTQEICLFPQLKWKQCIFLFLLGGPALPAGDLGGAGFLGKRLNYSRVLNVF